MGASNNKLRRYQKRPGTEVIAVQLDLDTDGFSYKKWGETQRCKQGDWLINNHGDTYTVNAETFRKTYREVQPGLFLKTTPVWAKTATSSGEIATKEGATDYKAGDYIVYNESDEKDGYAMSAEKFERMYEAIE